MMKMKNWILALLVSTAAQAAVDTGPAGSVYRVPDAGGQAKMGPVNIANPASITGILPIENGGTGPDLADFLLILSGAEGPLCGINQTCIETNKTIPTGSNHITGTAGKLAQFSALGDLEASSASSSALALLGSATASNTADTLVLRDGSGGFAAGTVVGTFTGNLTGNVTGNVSGSSGSTTGNAATATALAANPTDCSASQFAQAISSSGNLTCSQLTTADITPINASKMVETDGSGLLVSSSFAPATNSNTASSGVARDASGNFSAGTITATLSGTATNATNAATVSTTTNASFFPLFAASSSNGNQPFNLGTGLTFNPSTNTLTTTSFVGALTGNASTATTLASNPTDCGANTKATAIDASGNLTCSSVSNADLAGSIASSKLVGTDIATVGTITSGTWNGTKVAEAYGGTNQATYTTGDILYASASNTLSKLAIGSTGQALKVAAGIPSWGSVAASGSVNFLTDGDAEGTDPCATYADAAGNVPVDGTGGTATNLTYSIQTSTNLVGAKHFQMAQANSTSLQGKGVSCAFSIDTAFQARNLNVSFQYNASSTFVAANGTTAPLNDGTTTTNSGNSDIEVFVYDVTNSALIPVSPQVITANGSNNFQFNGTFQTASNSKSYRLIFHVATTSANATGWTFKFDNVTVGPQVVQQGPPVTDLVSYTPTLGSGLGAATNVAFFYRRIGDSVHIKGYWNNGTAAASLASISLPSGMTLDTTKINPTNTTSNPGAAVGFYNSSTGQRGYLITATGTSSSLVYFGHVASTAANLTPQNGDAIFSSSVAVTVDFKVPIAGWSSTVQMSNDTDTRVVSARYTTDAGQSISNNTVTIVDFEDKSKDTHSAVTTGSSWKYTVPVSGDYNVAAGIRLASGGGWSVGEDLIIFIYKNGSEKSRILHSSEATHTNAVSIGIADTVTDCVPGDTIDIRVQQVSGGSIALTTGASVYNFVSINRISGPSAVALSEPIYEVATGNPGSTTSGNILIFPTTNISTHGAYSTSTGNFTAPRSGYVTVTSFIFATNDNIIYYIYKNGVQGIAAGSVFTGSATSRGTVSGIVKVNAGDLISLRPDGTTGAFNAASNISFTMPGGG